MAKLIDAETVKEYLKRVIWGADPKIDKWVDVMPAVDAVPVEWLEGRLDRTHALGYEDAAQHYNFVLWAWEREKGADEDG